MKLWRQIRHRHRGSSDRDWRVGNRSNSPTLSTDSGQQSGQDTRSQSPSEELFGVSRVELMTQSGDTLGIVIAQAATGGVDKRQLCPSISSLRAGSVAHKSDALLPGDRITAVNGIETKKLRHQELVAMLKNVEERTILDIEYPLPPYNTEPALSFTTQMAQVTLTRDAGNLGFTLRGGANPDPQLSRALTITHVRPGGAADREGSIKSGDRLIAFDGTFLQSASLLDAQRILQLSQAQPQSLLSIEYDVSVLESVRHATGPLLVEIERPSHKELGITLADAEGKGSWISRGSQDGVVSSCVVIESIRPAGIAERCGALHVGDQILAVDETRIEGTTMSALDVTKLLNSRQGNHVTLEILPLSQINCGWRISEDNARSRGFLAPSYPSSSTSSPIGFTTLSSRQRRSSNKQQIGVNHTETLHISLQADQQGFGLTVISGITQSSILIATIEPGGPADRCGCLQVGDRILSTNHKSVVDGLTTEDVTSILDSEGDGSRLILEVEFDVADSVVPSSGIFSVKLAKRGNGLGITITASKNRSSGEPLLISDIRTGSVAHRTGTLTPGDRLLAIDSLQIDQCSIQDTQTILHNCGDIVTLKIQKDDSFSDVSDSKSIVYTVELVRYGGPLGITLAGSEERFEPINISALTSGGLAEQTGALHIGDRLLAINGESLRGKPLSGAIAMLHNCGDSVTMKIARSRPQPSISPVEEHSPASVDSAVESWDSCNVSPVNNNPTTEVYKSESATVKRKHKILLLDNQQMSGCEHWASHSMDSLDSVQSGIIYDQGKQPEDLEDVLLTPTSDSSECSNLDTKLVHYTMPSEESAPSPLPLPPYLRNHTLPNRRRFSEHQPYYEDVYQEEPREIYKLPTTSSDQNLELYQVTLFKDTIYEDFGFSVSDGLYERGVYINRVRKGGPADMSVTLKPFDRILQVNDTRTHDFDCCLTVPLIASAGEKLELTIARNTTQSYSTFHDHKECTDATLAITWVEEEPSTTAQTSSFTKTL